MSTFCFKPSACSFHLMLPAASVWEIENSYCLLTYPVPLIILLTPTISHYCHFLSRLKSLIAFYFFIYSILKFWSFFIFFYLNILLFFFFFLKKERTNALCLVAILATLASFKTFQDAKWKKVKQFNKRKKTNICPRKLQWK